MTGRTVAAIVLSAGASRRMGQPKALLTLPDGVTFAEAISRTARAAGVLHVCFVLGPPHGDEIRARLPAGAATAWNPDPGRGMLSSVQVGIAAMQHSADAALIWPIDQPLVTPATVRALLAAPAGSIALPIGGGAGGHPLLVPRDFYAAVLRLPGERGLRGLLEDEAGRVSRIPVGDPGAVTDFDTPKDYARLGSD